MVAVLSRLHALTASVLLVACLGACSAQAPAGTTDPPSSQSGPSQSGTAGSSATAASPSASASPTPSVAPVKELPRGGTTVFPTYRLVGYSGLTGASTLGRLGTGPLDERMAEISKRYSAYGAGRKILPIAEVITTIVQASPGSDGKYRARLDDDQIAVYLKAVRKQKGVLLLGIQPGRSDFMTEVKAYERWLKEPDVGLALDPEWAMGPGQVPGRVFGHTTGAELNEVSSYLSTIVARNQLPEKIMIYHQLAPNIVRQESGLKQHKGVAVVKSVDGIGAKADKIATYEAVNKTTPKFVHPGFKLFYTEDAKFGKLMSIGQVLGLKPRPDYVLYE